MYDSLFSRSGLSLERLRNFLMVVDSGSIAKAAGRDLNRQSLISRQIRELEEFFNIELTSRRGKGIEVTESGKRLGSLIRSHLGGLEDFITEAKGEPKTISIGGGGSAMSWLVSPVAGKLAEALGGASLKLENSRSLELVKRVREGQLDFAVVRSSAVPNGLPATKIVDVSYVLCVPRSMTVKGMGVAELMRGSPLALPVGGSFKVTLEEALRSMDVPWKPAVESSSFVQALSLVRTGQYASVLPSTGAVRLSPDQFSFKNVPFLKDHKRKIVLHWNERQVTTRDISAGQIKAMSRALSVK